MPDTSASEQQDPVFTALDVAHSAIEEVRNLLSANETPSPPVCGVDAGFGLCGRRPHPDDEKHAVRVGGGTDPYDDPEVWFIFGDERKGGHGYRAARLVD